MNTYSRRARENFIATVSLEKVPVPVDVARKILRYATTLQRLAEAQCNGDYPADNGERPVETCATCEQSWAPSVFTHREGYRAACSQCSWHGPDVMRKVTALTVENEHKEHPGFVRTVTLGKCPDCRVSEYVKTLLAPYGITPIFDGDPRGAVVKLKLPSGRSNSWGGEGGWCVP